MSSRSEGTLFACLETNIVKANIRALLTTTPQQPASTSAQVLDEKQRTLCELLERWATVGKISMSQAALIQHQCGYISQTTQQQASTAAAAAALVSNHHHHHNLAAVQQNGGSVPNKLPSYPTPPTVSAAHASHFASEAHMRVRSVSSSPATAAAAAAAVHLVKKRRSGRNKIVTLLMKNADGEYECVSLRAERRQRVTISVVVSSRIFNVGNRSNVKESLRMSKRVPWIG